MTHTAAMGGDNGQVGGFNNRRTNHRLSPANRFFKILLVASLYAKLRANGDSPDDWLLAEINSKFKIVSRLDALWIPVFMTPVLWKKFDPCKTLDDLNNGRCDLHYAKQAIMDAIPPIGRYVGVQSDIEKVLKDRLEIN